MITEEKHGEILSGGSREREKEGSREERREEGRKERKIREKREQAIPYIPPGPGFHPFRGPAPSQYSYKSPLFCLSRS